MASPASIRAFNRFYGQWMGGASRDYLGSGLSLPEARVVFEVATHPGGTAQEMLGRVRFEQAHLSRMLARLERRGLVEKRRGADRRRQALRLTPAGRRAFRRLDRRADAAAGRLVAGLQDGEQRQLAAHMQGLRLLLGDRTAAEVPVRIRRMRAGDLGWAFQRQAEMYREEFGYGPVFEAYVARGLPPFLDRLDRRRDGLWVAERDGLRLGCVAVQHDPERPRWAKLRWFFVERQARGAGVGGRLLGTAVAFCRRAGHEGIHLWTVSDLAAARRQYERAGFALAHEAPGPCPWAPWAREQRWELTLSVDAPKR